MSDPWAVNDKIDGFMSHPELVWLAKQASRMGSIIEIGSFMGRSTHTLCTYCPGTVFAVDHFKGSEEHQSRKDIYNLQERFMQNVGHFKNLKVIAKASADADPFDADMVFIDASHDKPAVAFDLAKWAPRARLLVCGHDGSYTTVSSAVEEYFGKPITKAEHTTIWYVEKGGYQCVQ